ncbi:ribosomal protein S18-alanine N-acetyltransferase [Enhydrobacter sp.]|uniref:ribosomal protein S18-alanine N-acetyltransferase n=1 Tax=Enhydrobacter sp. TaxID=1894999 RepID=UPI00260A2B3D|nr:ribosomal protein S18-alanine N-acetyltransferase [Enhydrobacter sp.]WIM11434.1 MAG: Ribosomal-protein-S18p-alanine acetyltransferase [Enhydrobacter sp.]
MTAAFSHRPLDAVDPGLVSALHVDAFAPLGERGWTAQEIAALMAAPGVAGVLLEQGGAGIGFALCRIAADEAELLTIAVRTDRRRQGAGRTLLELIVALARKRGAHRLFLEVGADNPAALALYRRAGFQTVGGRPAYYSRPGRRAADAVVMRLALD